MGHKHSVYDSDTHFSINPITRVIKNESSRKTTLIQGDHNSERFTFEIQRLVEGHDMADCDRVEIHYINVDATGSNQSADVYEVDDLQVSPDDSNVVICSWLISKNATMYAGSLNFTVRFVCLSDGVVSYAWHSAIHSDIYVSSGILNDTEAIITPYVDVLAQWKADLFGVGDTQEQRLLDVSAAQQNAIQAKGAATLSSIPEEYTALQAQADENSRNKAAAIVLEAEGESITVNDSADAPLLGLKLFGKSTQDGTPTPEAPVEIVSVMNPVVTVDEQTVALPYTLPGIPVTSGGNYTDADGQQWICDEVDLKRGVYVQRVNLMVLNGGETITQDSGYFKVHLGDVGVRNMHNLCSHYVSFVGGWNNMPDNTFQIIHDMLGVKDERFANLTAFKAYLTEQENAGKPVTLAYQLYTPIETPLSNAEITAFKSVRTNKPTTNILNDAGAFMAVEYAADTKTYIDNLVKGLMNNA